MKQKITIEIENDTGVEFEEVAHIKRVKEGQFYIGSYGDLMKMESPCTAGYHVVLTPKGDHELEEAKRKFVGKYVYTICDGETEEEAKKFLNKITDVFRNCSGSLLATSPKGLCLNIEKLIIFPIPVWRCCESDRPKTQGRYYTRRKRDHAERDLDEYCGENWEAINPEYISPLDYEWLDEGGE